MNETTTSISTGSGARLVRTAWQALRDDLLRDARVFRPLPPLSLERSRRLRPLRRIGARWLPHAVVVALVVFSVVSALDLYSSYGQEPLLLSLLVLFLQVTPPVMTLFRPVVAWWLSLTALAVSSLDETWIEVALAMHLYVMILVTLRSRPRIAVEMWLVSLAVGVVCEAALVPDPYVWDVPASAVFAAFVLAIAAAVRGWRLARGRAAEQETLVADVRGRHTLLEERARIARELHDVVAHHMSVIAIQAEAAPYRVAHPPEELTSSFATIRESAVQALAELRRVLGVLRFEGPEPGAPDAPQPDLSRLDELVDGVRAVGLTVEVVRTGAGRPLSQGVELSAFRIVQEALSNVLRHAPGARVRVEVDHVPAGLGLRIANTAPTGVAPPSPGMGHGVTGMRERAAMLGGELTARPTPDGGYEVAAFLPAAPAARPVDGREESGRDGAGPDRPGEEGSR